MVRHAVATYGHLSQLMLFIDVDEFMVHEAAERRATTMAIENLFSGYSISTTLTRAVYGGRTPFIGKVRLESDVMVPDASTTAQRTPLVPKSKPNA